MKSQQIHKITGLFVFYLSFIAVGYGQGTLTDNNILADKKPVVSSPNAAAIEKFVEFPTANYTGVPDISIPLCEVQTKKVKIPVGLSYHAGGIKVNDVSSDVGIGWALTAGGSISILNNGLIDEISGFPTGDATNFAKIKGQSLNAYYSGGTMPCDEALYYVDPVSGSDPYYIYSGGDVSFLRDVVEVQGDAEPDIYTFSFAGRSGKFVADENGTFRTMAYSELKIERIIESSLPVGYKITDETGNIYEFKEQETSYEAIYNAGSPSVISKPSRSYSLTKITTTDAEIINFYYSHYSFGYALQTTNTRAKTSTVGPCYQMNQTGDYFSTSFTTDSMLCDGTRIDSIKATNGTLAKFLYSSSNRTDIAYTKSMDTVQVWRYLPDRTKLKEILLTHDYSTGRLTLTGVKDDALPATQLTYNSTTLPSRSSYSQDHFGYYNDRTNTTLLPFDGYMEFWDGADRSIDTNYTQAGILKKISHSTGGSTEFVYEANQYFVPDTILTYSPQIGLSKASFPDATVSDTFSIPSTARKIRMWYTDSYDGTYFNNDYCIIHLTGPSSYSQDFMGNSNHNMPPLDLAPGLYTLTIENVGSTYSADMSISWYNENHVAPHNEIGGGVRIKEIRKNDSTANAVMVKKFAYLQPGTSKSSGVATFAPVYIQYRDQTINLQGKDPACTSTYCQLMEQSSNSITPLTFANGNFVSYTDVNTYMKDSTQNGYSSYKYNLGTGGFNTGIPSFPFAPRIFYDWTDGLAEQTDYAYINSQYKKLKKTKYSYNYDDFDPAIDTTIIYKAYGAKIGVQDPPFVCWLPCTDDNYPTSYYSDLNFGIQYYQFYSSWHRLEKTEEINYNPYGSDSLLTTTNYFYDNPASIQTSRTKFLNSKGDTIIQKMTYPADYSSYGFVQNLMTKNAVALPIEGITIRKDNSGNQYVTGGQITTYKSSEVQTDRIYDYETASPVAIGSYTTSSMNSSSVFSMDSKYKEKASMDGYDALGNIRQLQKASDIKLSYIWDYISTKPIAEATNADSASIAFTSFEADGKGGWTYSGSNSGSYFITGSQSYNTGGGNITKSGLTNRTYIVSYWGKSGSVNVNSAGPTRTGKTIGDWTYYEHEVTSTSITVSGSNYIDELRLYPKGAQMKTYAYTPLVGLSTTCDENNRILHYEYDIFNRLKLIKDEDGRIIKRIDYKYQATYQQ